MFNKTQFLEDLSISMIELGQLLANALLVISLYRGGWGPYRRMQVALQRA